MSWIEINDSNNEIIEKVANLSNSQFSCFQTIGITDSVNDIKRQLNYPKYHYRGFFYQDDKFTIYFDIRKKQRNNFWEIMRCWVKWDLTDRSINPMDAVTILGNKTVEILKEIKGKFYMKPLDYDKAPITMQQWFNPQLAIVYNELGLNLTHEKKGNMCELYIELI